MRKAFISIFLFQFSALIMNSYTFVQYVLMIIHENFKLTKREAYVLKDDSYQEKQTIHFPQLKWRVYFQKYHKIMQLERSTTCKMFSRKSANKYEFKNYYKYRLEI